MRAPTYQSQTNAPSGSQVRLQAPDTSGVGAGVARGLQSAARGIGQYAEAEFAIQERHNDISSRRLALEWRKEAQPLIMQYRTLRGSAAVDEAEGVRKRIAELRDTYAERAGNSRQRELFSLKTDEQLVAFDGDIVSHGLKEQWQSDWDTTTAELAQVQTDVALNPLDKTKFEQGLNMIAAVSQNLSILAGDTPEVAENRLRSANDVVITTAIDGMLKDPNVDLDLVLDFYEQNRDLLSAKGVSELAGVLARPRLDRALDNELDGYVSGISPVADADAGGGVASSAPTGTAPRQTPATGPVTDDFRGHQARGSAGLDIAAPRGSAIKPVADGVVEEAGTGKTGGNFIRIRHADGTLTSYMHMGQPPAYKKGDRVTQSTVIGTVGSTGRASGPHLHLEVKDAQGRQIDPEEYLKGASPVGAPSEPRAWNNAAVLEAIKRDEDAGKITPERADQLRARFQRRVNIDQSIIDSRDAEAVTAVQEWMLVPGNLDNFTSYEQLPANIRAGFKPETALRFVEVARQGEAAQATANTAALKQMRDMEYARLTGMMSYDEEAFMALDPTTYAGMVEPEQWAALASKRAQMLQKRNQGALDFLPGPKIKSTITSLSIGDGEKIKEGDAKFGAIATIMADRANAFIRDNNGKLPSDADFVDFYRYATAKVPAKYSRGIDTLFMQTEGEAPRYEITGTVEAAASRNAEAETQRAAARTRNRLITGIRSEYIRQNGVAPTPEQIERRLRLMQGQ